MWRMHLSFICTVNSQISQLVLPENVALLIVLKMSMAFRSGLTSDYILKIAFSLTYADYSSACQTYAFLFTLYSFF